MSRIEAFQATGSVAIVTGGRDYADAQKGGRGTADMVAVCQAAGITVVKQGEIK